MTSHDALLLELGMGYAALVIGFAAFLLSGLMMALKVGAPHDA